MIVLVTDSTAYLTRQEAKALGVVQVPMTYTFEGRTLYSEGYIDEDDTMVVTVAEGVAHYSTAQASLAAFLSTLEDIVAEGNQVLCITISSRLSGTYANARKAAQEIGGDGITVVDSKATAGAMYLLLVKAREWCDAGLSLAEVAVKVKEAREKTYTFFSVEDMEPLRKSGRLGDVRQSVSNVLNVRPILTCTDGWVKAQGISRGDTQTIKALLERIPPQATDILIHHQGEKYDPIALMKTLQIRFPEAHIEIRPLGPSLRIHLGAGFIGIAWMAE